MITIRNTQRKLLIDCNKVVRDTQIILDMLGYGDFDLGIWFTNNANIRHYNSVYRHKNRATDILSFPYHQLRPGERIIAQTEEDKNLGDIIISLEFVQKQIEKMDILLMRRIQELLVHGICHLLGYDHIQDEDYVEMQEKEEELLRKLEA